MSVDFPGVYPDHTRSIDIGIFDGVGDQFVYEQSQRNGLVCGDDNRIGMTLKRVFRCGTLKISTKMTDEVGEIDKSYLAASPQMIMNFRDRCDPHGCIFQSVLHVHG